MTNCEEESIEEVLELLDQCYDDPDLFNDLFLNGPSFWEIQRDWCKLLVEHASLAIETGNALGKDFWVSRIVAWWLYTRPDSLVIVTGPGQTLLGTVTWKEIRRAVQGDDGDPENAPPIPLGAKMSQGIKTSPHTVVLGNRWQALGFSTTTVERGSGQHAEELLVIVEEASGVDPEIWQAIDSLKASKILAIGNPLRADGGFVDMCNQAISDRLANIPIKESVGYSNVPSTMSPHAKWDKSPFGLADRIWLEQQARKYGRDSLWYRAHVLAIRPKQSHERLIQPEHLDACYSLAAKEYAEAERLARRGGTRRISCDVGEGVGNARSVIVVRDDVGILEIFASTFATPHDTAVAISGMAHKWRVAPESISYDGAGQTGKRLGNALAGQNLPAARAYFGSGSGGRRCTNLRTAAALALARRIDPDTHLASGSPNPPFHIPSCEHDAAIREELLELKYELKGDKSALEDKESLMERLQRSPDFADAITQAFREEAIRG